MYKLVRDEINGGLLDVVLKPSENLSIPMVEGNRHYQEYLAWLAEGNTPEEAD